MEHPQKINYFLISTILITLFFLMLSPYIIRHLQNQPLLYTGEPYYHSRTGQLIKNQGLPSNDPLISSIDNYDPNLYDSVLAFLFIFVPPDIVSVLLPALLGTISLVLIVDILSRLQANYDFLVVALLLVGISPIFISIFGKSSPDSLAAAIVLLSISVLLRYSESKFSVFLLVLSAFLNPIHALAGLLALLLLSKQRNYRLFAFFSVLFSIALVVFSGVSLIEIQPFDKNFSDVWVFFGFGIFQLMLAFIGITLMIRRRKKLRKFNFMIFGLVALSFLDSSILIYLSFFVSFLAAIAFLGLYRLDWELPQIKFGVLLLLICGILFSTLSFINEVASAAPDSDMKEAMDWLSVQETGIIFTHPSNGFFVQQIAGKPVMTDQRFLIGSTRLTRILIPEIAQKEDSMMAFVYNESNVIFHSRNLKTTKQLLIKYNISHILIDSKMQAGLVWEKEEQGLLFLFVNNETFKKVYNNSKIEIWQVLPTGE